MHDSETHETFPEEERSSAGQGSQHIHERVRSWQVAWRCRAGIPAIAEGFTICVKSHAQASHPTQPRGENIA